MRKPLLTLMCLAAMMSAGMGLRAQEITITLSPYWNWISYPNAVPMELNEALGDFVPAEGDIIKSRDAFVVYQNGVWSGVLTHFMPGKGYMYRSARTETVSFVFAQPSSSVVATATPTDVTVTSAVAGGLVMLPEGSHVFLRGVCWGTTPSPDIDGSHTTDGTGIGSFTTTLEGLDPNTTYYVRAYVVSDYGLAYGNEVSFITVPIWTIEATPNPTEGGTITGAGDYEQNAVCTLTAIANEGYVFANWTENGEVVSTDATYTFTVDGGRTLVANFNLDHTYVDLGLPSGLLWATCNVGADIPEEYGDYFAWGETQPKDNFSWTNYQYCMGSFNTLTKYCNNPDIGYNGFTDDLTTLLPEDDAATANWGDEWRMPTEGEWQELYENTTVTWTIRNGVRGRLFTASNGNSIFMPAAGYCNESAPEAAGIIGDYWTSSLDTDYPSGAMSFFFNSSNYYISFCNRLYGRNVRAVYSEPQNTSYIIDATVNPAEGGMVSGGGSYQAGTECTLTATANEGYVFTNWSENGEVVSVNAIYIFTVNTDRTLVANFTMQSFTVGVSANPSNGGSVSGGDNYNYGQSCTVSATANVGFIFSNWTENDSIVSTDANYTFTVNLDRILVANFTYAPSWSNGVLPGVFSVSATQQVNFSQGNLQYIGSASTPYWKFAENQWECLGSTQNGAGQNIDRDLFGWATSGCNNGNYYYRPWDTSYDPEGRYRGFGYGPYDGTGTQYNLTGIYANSDWGVYNPISNGGSQSNQWRTLTKNEWVYVFNTRSTVSGIRYAKANVNDMNGVILLPDNWSASTYSLNNTNTSSATFSSNILTASQWSILEQAGAVFLPAAGYRSVTSSITPGTPSANLVGSSGCYWSVSSIIVTRSLYLNANDVSFNESMLNPESNAWRCYGFSVRLVRLAQ